MAISITQILEGGQFRPLSTLESDVTYIGREPPEGIIVESGAVSRSHGVFLTLANQWFYKDLGSTNGSWLNGQHIGAGQPYLLRDRDRLQLADIMLDISITQLDESPSVIVFSRGDFYARFPVPEVGKVVSVGGAKGDLKLDVDFQELPVIVVEKRSNFLCAYPVATDKAPMRNDQPLSQLVQLKDRDVLSVAPYVLTVSIPSLERLAAIGMDNQVKSQELKETFTGWEEREKPVERTLFGQFYTGNTSEESDAERTVVTDMRPSSRFMQPEQPKPDMARVVEERVVFILGFLLVGLILALIIWWLVR